MTSAVITIESNLRLTISPTEGKEVVLGLNRIAAQNLAASLLEYCGATSQKSVTTGRETAFAVHDLTPRAEAPRPTKTVRLSPKRISVGR
jgi:hypothetical protein